jgi:hypothetical protein
MTPASSSRLTRRRHGGGVRPISDCKPRCRAELTRLPRNRNTDADPPCQRSRQRPPESSNAASTSYPRPSATPPSSRREAGTGVARASPPSRPHRRQHPSGHAIASAVRTTCTRLHRRRWPSGWQRQSSAPGSSGWPCSCARTWNGGWSCSRRWRAWVITGLAIAFAEATSKRHLRCCSPARRSSRRSSSVPQIHGRSAGGADGVQGTRTAGPRASRGGRSPAGPLTPPAIRPDPGFFTRRG